MDLEIIDDFIQKYSDKQRFNFKLEKCGDKVVCGFIPVGRQKKFSDWFWWSFVGQTYGEAIEGAIAQAEKNMNNFIR